MSAAGAGISGRPPDEEREELLYEGERTRVSRHRPAPTAGWTVHKELLGDQAIERQRHERRILERLAGLAGVPQLAPGNVDGELLILEETPGFAGAQALLGLRPHTSELVHIALQLAQVVAGLHRRGVAHKDINPSNVLRSADGQQVLLIDFDLATTFAEERPAFVAPNQIAGTLAYLAPEQTGRTGRSVDARVDLYGMGATFYELATGRPPFADSDPLQLIHDLLVHLPTAPLRLEPRLPPALSEILMRLLEKEPDRRYQSADGLVHDLLRLRAALAAGDAAPFPLGERDFSLRLSPPSQLVGRQQELGALRSALDQAMRSRCRLVLVSGAPGVGKTALLNELRPLVTARRGWFISGKFDQHRQDLESDAVRQALDGLYRLLLAEPEAVLAQLRPRLLQALGPNAGLAAAVLPVAGQLLGIAPDASAAASATEERLIRSGVDLLHAAVSPERPVVMFIDDLQWGAATPLGLLDAVLMDEGLRGLLVVAAYRDAAVDATHPLAAMLARWQRLGAMPEVLRLDNLPPDDLGRLIGQILRLPPAQAAALAAAVATHSGGNPYDTVELLNALRHEGILSPQERGWLWDDAALRRYVGQGNVLDLLATRIGRLPLPTAALLDTMACLGGEIRRDLLRAASGLADAALEQQLMPALEDGLLVFDGAGSALRFRHDRAQQAAYGRMSASEQRQMHLTLARRLAAQSEYALAAADQYLATADALEDASECRRAAQLFRLGAAHAGLVANHPLVERYLDSALRLLERLPDAEVATDADADAAQIELLRRGRHAALYNAGRLDEADRVYQEIEQRGGEVLALADAACVQVSSLTNRARIADALALGRRQLGQLGLAPPAALGPAIEQGLDRLYEWARQDTAAAEAPAAMSDPRLLTAARLINRLMPPAFFGDQALMAWLVIQAQRLWTEHGACAALVGPLSHVAFVTIPLRQDYRTGYQAIRRVLAVGEARAYEPETSQARFLYALGSGPWFNTLEDSIAQAQRAHEGLLRGGDLQNACYTYYASLLSLLDCTPTLEAYGAEVETALSFAARTGNDHAAAAFAVYRQLVRSLRGQTREPGGFTDASFDEAQHLAALGSNPTAAANFHTARALAAAVFGDSPALAQHAAAAMPLLPFIEATQGTTLAHLLQALACAERARTAAAEGRAAALAELEICADWLARRAADAPLNFLHLSQLVNAERAWAAGDSWGAARAFDAALREAVSRVRPWQHALIAERSARFHREQGLEHRSRELLAEAQRRYRAWGALAKVQQLERAHAFLRGPAATARSRSSRSGSWTHSAAAADGAPSSVSTDAIDMLAVLRASQALSSETSVARLSLRLNEVLGAMTGATRVQLVLRGDGAPSWLLSQASDQGADTLSLDDPRAQALLPLSALRYAERTGTPLLVEDATRDDRFASDAYIRALDRCSLLVVPVLNHGMVRAMLVLENRLGSGAFSAQRLDAVQMIAGQLAVSLENALLYGSLERKVAERTQALEIANRRLEMLSITDALTGLANRRRFTEILEREWQRALRTRSSLGVAMVDVDHFKRYNDHYGHLAGDACLQRVAATLAQSVREDLDLAARYGGEEFALIYPGAPLQMAQPLAERARAAVAALREPHAASDYGIVTVSVGLAVVVPTPGGKAEHSIGLADAALYEAKRAGRNRIALARGAVNS